MDTYYITLIQQKLNQNIAPQKEKELNDWLAQSEENRDAFAQIKQIWEEAQKGAAALDADYQPDVGESMEAYTRSYENSANSHENASPTCYFI